ncbi:MAG: hypothetical protein AB7O68_21360 [Pirellulales bacterium]
MLTNIGFEVLLASLPDHDSVVAEIYCDGKFVGMLSENPLTGRLDFEMPGGDMLQTEVTRRVDLDGLLGAVGKAHSRLLSLSKTRSGEVGQDKERRGEEGGAPDGPKS